MKHRGILYRMRFNGIPVIFLHAFPLNHKMWHHQLDYLEDISGCYMAYDYPGFGESENNLKEPSIYDYGKPVIHMLEEMHIDQAVFVGVSMGGYVALSLYRHHPEKFAGLVLANTRASADSSEAREARLKTIRELKETNDPTPLFQSLMEKFFTPETRQKNAALVEEVQALMQEATVEGIIQALGAMAERPDSMDLLGQMDFPVLVIAGEKDELTSVREARDMVDALPIGDLTVIPDAAHLSNLERPDVFNDVLHLYLKKLLESM